jgi:hypothetical protein
LWAQSSFIHPLSPRKDFTRISPEQFQENCKLMNPTVLKMMWSAG